MFEPEKRLHPRLRGDRLFPEHAPGQVQNGDFRKKEMAIATRREAAIARLLRLCRGMELPAVTEGTGYGAPSVQVKGRNFTSVKAEDSMVRHCRSSRRNV